MSVEEFKKRNWLTSDAFFSVASQRLLNATNTGTNQIISTPFAFKPL